MRPLASRSFSATLHDASNGSFSATYTFDFSDQDLPGATALPSKTLVLTGIIATPGDTFEPGPCLPLFCIVDPPLRPTSARP